jgi:hypothetical protein
MGIRSGLFNSVQGDRRYKANFFAEYFASFIGNGVFPNPSTGFQVIASGTDMSITLKAGKAWINGYYAVNDGDYVLSLDNADGVLNRIDRIVLQLNYLNREITSVIKKGTFASSPVAPTLQRDADVYELGLADIYIANGVTIISQANVTDLRMNSTYCGIVAGTVEQIDVSSVFNQYQDWFNSYSINKAQEFVDWQAQTKQSVDDWINSEQLDFGAWRTEQEGIYSTWYNQQQSDFITWFNSMKDQLSVDAAGSLQLQMDDHKAAAMPHQFVETTTGAIYKYGFKTNDTKDGLIFVYEEVL